MTNETIVKLDEEISRIDESFRKTEEEGLRNILRYFDRIHDKLFSFNNILIAGYFAIIKLEEIAPVISILLPIANLAFLIYIEYRMLEKSKIESQITKVKLEKINQHEKNTYRTNLYSLLVIMTTFLVTLVFLFYLFF